MVDVYVYVRIVLLIIVDLFRSCVLSCWDLLFVLMVFARSPLEGKGDVGPSITESPF